MKSLIFLIVLSAVLPISTAMARDLTATEIAMRMHLQAKTQMVVSGVQQGARAREIPPSTTTAAGSFISPKQEFEESENHGNAGATGADSEAIELQILFEFSSPKLAPVAVSQLDELCKAFRLSTDIQQPFTIIGHTDAVGNQASNLTLSAKRAEAVRLYLVEECGITASRLKADGKGESQLRAGLNPRDPKHRRVEVKIQK